MRRLRIQAILIFTALLVCSAHLHAHELPGSIEGRDLISGQDMHLDLKKKDYYIVLFLSSVCPCSLSHEPVIKKLFADYKNSQIHWVGIHSNSDEDLDFARKHFNANSLGFPILHDNHAELADHFGALKTPHVFIVHEGKVIFEGGVDDSQVASHAKNNFLAQALEAIAQGRSPPVSSVRTLGCKIKRSS